MDNIIIIFLEKNWKIIGDFYFCNSQTYIQTSCELTCIGTYSHTYIWKTYNLRIEIRYSTLYMDGHQIILAAATIRLLTIWTHVHVWLLTILVKLGVISYSYRYLSDGIRGKPPKMNCSFLLIQWAVWQQVFLANLR